MQLLPAWIVNTNSFSNDMGNIGIAIFLNVLNKQANLLIERHY